MLLSLIVGTVVGLVTGSALLWYTIWISGGLWQLPNFLAAWLRGRDPYRGSMHERHAYAESSSASDTVVDTTVSLSAYIAEEARHLEDLIKRAGIESLYRAYQMMDRGELDGTYLEMKLQMYRAQQNAILRRMNEKYGPYLP